MIQKRTTSVLYLCFSILVAFSNALTGEPYFFIFCIPFIIAISVKDKLSKIFEFIGLFIISVITIFSMGINTGILIFSITTALFYTMTLKKQYCYSFIAIGALLVCAASCVNPTITNSRVVSSFLYSSVYIVASSCFYVYSKEIRAKDPKNCALEQKYIDLIDQLSDVAHESIDALKKMQDGKI